MDRQRKRRLELEDEKRALAFGSPRTGTGGSIVGSGTRRRIDLAGDNAYDSPKSGYSGSSSMYTDEKGLTVGVGGLTLEGNRSHMLLGGDRGDRGSQFAVPQQHTKLAQKPRDFLDDDHESEGEMSV
jgi:hypothetical protein